jgi:hypothetical protein
MIEGVIFRKNNHNPGLIRAIKELVRLKDREKRSREDSAQARENMEKLYNMGFTPDEIWFFVSWLALDTVKRYCRGLEVKDTKQREHILELLGEYVKNDGNWDELQYYVDTKKKLEQEDMSIDDLLDVKKDVDLYNIDLSGFGRISAKLEKDASNWDEFIDQFSLPLQVLEQGWTVEQLSTLKEKTNEFGFDPLVKNIAYAYSQEQINAEEKKFNKKLEELVEEANEIETLITRLDLKHSALRTHILYAKTLVDEYNMDLSALKTIISVAKKLGDPIQILDSLITYIKIYDLELQIIVKQGELENITKKIATNNHVKETLDAQIIVLNQNIGAIQERHRQSFFLQSIANLLDNPFGVTISPEEFIKISQTLMITIQDYARAHSDTLSLYNLYVKKYVNNAANNLTRIQSGKLL